MVIGNRHPYDELLEHLTQINQLITDNGLEGRMSKGGLGEFLLAARLNHRLSPVQHGPDAYHIRDEINPYEYKVTLRRVANFNFGANEGQDIEQLLTNWSETIDGAYCANYLPVDSDFDSVIFIPSDSIRDYLIGRFVRLEPRQLTATISHAAIIDLDNAEIIELPPIDEMIDHPYFELYNMIDQAFLLAQELGIEVRLAKGGVGEIALARHLNHLCYGVADGPDAHSIGEPVEAYEYKVSESDQYNFDFGVREDANIPELIESHFEEEVFCYCAARDGLEISRILRIPINNLIPVIVNHFNSTRGARLNMNWSFDRLSQIQGSTEI